MPFCRRQRHHRDHSFEVLVSDYVPSISLISRSKQHAKSYGYAGRQSTVTASIEDKRIKLGDFFKVNSVFLHLIYVRYDIAMIHSPEYEAVYFQIPY